MLEGAGEVFVEGRGMVMDCDTDSLEIGVISEAGRP